MANHATSAPDAQPPTPHWRLEVNGYGRWRVIEAGVSEYWAEAKYFRNREKAERWLQKRLEHDERAAFKGVK